MPELFLLRHAKSDWSDPGLSDIERPLNARGRGAARAMGRYLAGRGRIDAVWGSSAVRVGETIDGLRAAFEDLPHARIVERLYAARAETLLEVLRAAACERLLLVAHNPGLHDLAMLLTRDRDSEARRRLASKFPTAALAEISFDGDWQDLDAGSARVAVFTRPRDL